MLSGVNNGQNIGPFIKISGTVGAARAAAARGIPRAGGERGRRRADELRGSARTKRSCGSTRTATALAADDVHATVTNLNVPTCAHGSTRPLVVVPVAPPGVNVGAPVNCVTPAPKPVNDVDGFVHGYIVETDNLPASA